MFDTIRRHQKWLWIVIMTVTIISFVAFFSPTNQMGGSVGVSRSAKVGSINGRPISRDEYVRAYREAELRYLFVYNEWPSSGDSTEGMIRQETGNRLLLIEKMRTLGIEVSDSAVAKWIIDTFQDPEQKKFRQDAYDQFVKNRLAARGISARDFESYVRHELGIQHLLAIAGISGKLVTPQEGEELFRRENEEIDTQAVFLSRTNFLDKVPMDPLAIATYYTNQQAAYRIPERVQVNYVPFRATNYFAEAEQTLSSNTNLAMIIENTYQARGTNTFVDSNNQPLPPEAAKEKLRAEFRQQFAMNHARKKAVEFTSELLDLPTKPESLPSLAAAKGLLSMVTEPFTERDGPTSVQVPPTFAEAAFRLTPEEPFRDSPIVGEDAVYVIGFQTRLPSEMPSFEMVKQRVEDDYKRSKSIELVKTAGEELLRTITNGMAQGKSFEAAVAEAQQTPVDLPPFSQSTTTLDEIPSRASFPALKNVTSTLAPGVVSPFTSTSTGGFIAIVQAKIPAAADKVQRELPQFLSEMRRRNQYEAFTGWLRKELEVARISLPGDQQTAN
jgi:hypothetical protein